MSEPNTAGICTTCGQRWEIGHICYWPVEAQGKPDTEPKRYGPGTSQAHEQGQCLPNCGYCADEAVERVQPEPVSLAKNLHEFWQAQSEWSQATFGTDAERGPIGPLRHLAKEAAEAQEHPTDPFEYADCLFLVFDSARRAGFTLDQLTEFCWQKLEINKKRNYPKTTDMNVAVEHER